MPIEPCQLPTKSLLNAYHKKGAYTDCYRTEIEGTVKLAEYLNAFYTTGVFRVERIILQWVVSKPSTDAQARQLAEGLVDHFAAWQVESRSEDQLLLCDFQGRTRSWLMAMPVEAGKNKKTYLYFGSALTPGRNSKPQTPRIGSKLLLGFHKIYSRVLLHAASSRLKVQLYRD